MTKTAKAKAYDTAYEARPEQVKKRVQRNQARALMIEKGLAHKGDGKEVDHIRPIGAGGTNNASNLRTISKEQNRGWRKGESGYKPKKA